MSILTSKTKFLLILFLTLCFRVIYLLDSLFSVTNPEAFICALWNILLSFPFIRLSAHIYIHLHLSKGVTDVCKAIKEVDACIDLIVG